MNEIIKILQEIRPDSDFQASESFIDDYLLDSFDIITLTSELEDTYNIQIPTSSIVPENFQSIEAIADLVRNHGGAV